MAYTTINKSSEHFNTKLYTGNSGTQNITGLDFQPDFVWTKNRDDTWDNTFIDAVRGGTKYIRSNSTNAEATNSTMITAFNSDGYTVGEHGDINRNNERNVSWNWLANGAGSANTAGSINSTVSANTTSGFSIVSYTGTGANATVGHGLGSASGLIILKNLTTNRNWQILHHKNTAAPATQQLEFGTDATATVTSQWNSVMPTSSVFSIGTNDSTNKSGNSFIAYCFAEKQGYSKFGSYTGNGNNDGTFIYTGFKPAFVMFKNTSAAGDWTIQDSGRDTYNLADARLYSNLSNVENDGGGYGVDFLSNGIKIRTSSAGWNTSGQTYIYMSFAEQPLVGTNNVPCTAR